MSLLFPKAAVALLLTLLALWFYQTVCPSGLSNWVLSTILNLQCCVSLVYVREEEELHDAVSCKTEFI